MNATHTHTHTHTHVQVLYTVSPQPDYLHSAVSVVLQIHSEEEGDGDILVFLTGREEIETMGSLLQHCRPLFPTGWKEMIVCPLFAALPTKQQQRAFIKTPEVC